MKQTFMNTQRYNPSEIESKWQKIWEEKKLYKTIEDKRKPKYYCLDFFPYPSGASLSVGHCRNYVPTDVISRYKRMKGLNVLHPMGWDAFGLPGENDAIKKGLHPMDSIPQNIANFKRQLNLIGTSYDWDREINSTDPAYYRWTQWFFLLLYKRDLAYRAEALQWWCPSCKTVLANEQVEDGKCWRCASDVTKKPLKQWFFKITAYADRLLSDLKEIDWPQRVKLMQENWIGRSEGLEMDFKIGKELVPVFTTRPDTIFGATFLVLAPEHSLVEKITSPNCRSEVADYITQAKKKTDIIRLAEGKEKTGVFTGSYAINLISNISIPIWIADYVLLSYGTGMIMGVPAHDQRDFEFAQKYHLPIREVIKPSYGRVSEFPDKIFSGEGILINSGDLDGLSSKQAFDTLVNRVEKRGLGKRKINYRMRDWLISRQRYWGAPIPMVHCKKCGTVPVPEKDLPVVLPRITDFEPSGTGRSPLSKFKEFVETTCPQCGIKAERETDTQDGFACSSWYFLRYASPYFGQAAFDRKAVDYWLPVDLYVGGAEHAVMHLLYARFYTKVMFDAGLINFNEPFSTLKNQGLIMAADGRKMSKSYGNVITPDDVVARAGADSLRLYELFIGPFEQEVAWSEQGINGVRRFLDKTWKIVLDDKKDEGGSGDDAALRQVNRTIKKVGEDIENFKFNTAVSALMEYVNFITDNKTDISKKTWGVLTEMLVLLLAPMCPHIAEELWQKAKMGAERHSVHTQNWPSYDSSLIAHTMVTMVVQVNGKVRDSFQIEVEKAADKTIIETKVKECDKMHKYLADKVPQKVIFVPGKLINFVV